MTLAAVVAASLATNVLAGIYVFLGAFTYGVVYTVWLKRRTWWNIVVGGLAGSFAVLARRRGGFSGARPGGAGARSGAVLWTPPHFWALAIACRRTTPRRACRCFRWWSATRAPRAPSTPAPGCWWPPRCFPLLPWAVYLYIAAAGGAFFLAQVPGSCSGRAAKTARAAFLASLAQLSAALLGAMADVAL